MVLDLPFGAMLTAVALVLTSGSCAVGPRPRDVVEAPPLEEVPVPEWPDLGDDLDVASLAEGCAHSLAYLERVPGERAFRFSEEEYKRYRSSKGFKQHAYEPPREETEEE